jgi:hypothetical protein
MKASLVLVFALMAFVTYSQKDMKGVPANLKDEKIIFLEYEQIPIDPSWPKILSYNFERRNKEAIKANDMLAKRVKDYPYASIISRRSEYKSLATQGVRYVLESEIMKALNNGEQVGGLNKTYYAMVYVYDLTTGDRYELFKLTESRAYDYNWIMDKFISTVKKTFK